MRTPLGIVVEKYPAMKQAGRRFIQGCIAYPVARVRGNAITTYWGFRNFGDLITPFLLRQIGYTPVNCARVSLGQFVFVGSILDSIREDYKGVILGSGLLNAKRPKRLNQAVVLGVRGLLTKQTLAIEGEAQLGDPGLILPKFLGSQTKREFRLGIVPHYLDSTDARIASLACRFGADAKVIDVLRPPTVVFREIGACQFIASSSLHGLVVADSLGIPSLWMVLSDLCGNKEFKFHDYYTAFGEKRSPYVPSGTESLRELLERMTPPSDAVADVAERVYELFLSISDYFPKRNGRVLAPRV